MCQKRFLGARPHPRSNIDLRKARPAHVLKVPDIAHVIAEQSLWCFFLLFDEKNTVDRAESTLRARVAVVLECYSVCGADLFACAFSLFHTACRRGECKEFQSSGSAGNFACKPSGLQSADLSLVFPVSQFPISAPDCRLSLFRMSRFWSG